MGKEAFTVNSESGKIRDELISGKVAVASDGGKDLVGVPGEIGRPVGVKNGSGLSVLDT